MRLDKTTTVAPETKTQAISEQSVDQPVKSQTRIAIYPDGSCIVNPGHGGWGAVLLRYDPNGAVLKKGELSGSDPSTTNNRMEMIAVCEALEGLGRVTNEPIEVLCDAALIPNAMNGWLSGWKTKGWKKSSGEDVRNRDLWERLEKAARGRNVTWTWVRGHNGNTHNERADKLAYAAARRCEEAMKKGKAA